jgi:mono/diheme cytochrome c family protein
MNPVLRWAFATAGAIAAFAAIIPLYVYVASEAAIQRRYPLSAIEEPAAPTAKDVARGMHLAAIAGCGDCHGADFEGRLMTAGPLPVWSSNLRLSAHGMTDGEFERALRRGIARDAMSLWGMPSEDFTYMSEADVAALLAFLRNLGSAGHPRPRPVWNREARLELLDGRIIPAVLAVGDSASSLDLGPRFDGGRYLARISCSECHGTDLEGAGHAPNLDILSRYTRAAFFDLLRRGVGARHRPVPVMKRLAAVRFHVFADYEIMALYDYLDARAHAPPALLAREKTNESRHRAAIDAQSEE